jgi:molecular chaperone GrpE
MMEGYVSKKETPPSNGGKSTGREAAVDTEVTNEAQIPVEPQTDGKDGVGAQSSELDVLRRESMANLEGWQRTLAEFQNYKKRTERETRDTYQNATLDALKNLLPIIDDFERAMANLPEAVEGQTWLSGISLIHRKFMKLLEDYNITMVDPVGEVFDPNRHQAIGTVESSEVESGHVAETLQKGFISGDRVLRPAVVKVAE